MSYEPNSSESPWHFDMCPEAGSSDSNPADNEPIPDERNEYYPKYFIDEFENLDDYLTMYARYRIAGGRMKFKESDAGEQYYTQFAGIELDEIREWHVDRSNIAPCEWTMCNKEYIEWFLSAHPKPVDIREVTRYWLNRREQLWRRQHPAPESYEEFLQNRDGLGRNYEDGFYDYVHVPTDTWDKGSLFRMHMIRQQAAIDLKHNTEDGAYITEQQIDYYLIANHEDDKDKMERTLAAQQKYEATLKMVRESNAKAGIYRDATRIWPKPVPVRTLPEKHDWDFFYRSLQAAPETRSAILATMSSGRAPVLKSELRTQRATTLSERIGNKQHAMQAAIRKQRNVMRILTPEPR